MIGKEKRSYNKQNKLSALVENVLCCDIDRRYYSPLYKRGGYWAAELAFAKTFGTVIRNRQKLLTGAASVSFSFLKSRTVVGITWL